VVGYDGDRNVRDEEHPVERKKLVRKAEPPSKRRINWPRWTGFRGITIRAWLDLLVVPLALVVIGFLFSVQQDARQQRIEDQRAQEAQNIENRRAEAERELAEQRAQDEALQAYLSQMSSLLLDKDLRTSEEDSEVRTLARARTLTVLGRLDPSRKTAVTRFLSEAKLVQRVEGRAPIISLSGANLNLADLSDAKLSANLENANLWAADLKNANLRGANLKNANLSSALLSDADLGGAAEGDRANLRGTDLTNANLAEANLFDANLTNAYLGANLKNANLGGVEGVTKERLEQEAVSLAGATMPDFTVHD
jgi:uncharacterized protein YjbI with pentapeptide repeats